MMAFYAAVVLNVPLSLFLLTLYRRAVVQAMHTEIGSLSKASVPRADSPKNKNSGAALVIETIDLDTPITTPHSAVRYSTASLGWATLVSAVAGTLFVLVITLGWQLTLGGRFYFVWFLWWVVVNAWPIPLAIGLVTGAAGLAWVKPLVLYVLIFIALSAVCLDLYDNLDVLTLSSNTLTTLLIAVPVSGLLYRPIRAVGMLVFTFTLMVFAIAPLLAFAAMHSFVALSSGDGFWTAPAFIILSLLSAEGFAILTFLCVTAIICALGWWTLNQIGGAYRKKCLSDQSLLLNSLWAVVALSHATLLSTQQGGLGASWAWFILPIAAFGTYWLVERTGLALLTRQTDSCATAPVLLMLRVFSLGKRSERLFEILTPYWLRTGSIAFIAGPDLATRTVQPNQFLEYLARRLRQQFVKDDADLSRRLASVDLLPDPDGRYRVNQFFCFADTWQDTVRRLSRRVNMVLMDLRNLSTDNQGCLYEIEQLFDHVPVGRILLITDDTTDWPFLEATLNRLWAGVSRESPNRALTSSRLKVLRIDRATSRQVRMIIQLILDNLMDSTSDQSNTL